MAKWLPVPGFETLYEVSDEGEIRSLCGRYGFNRVLKLGVGSKGYLNVSLCKKGYQKTENVHRIVATVFIPNRDGLPCINHKDGNKQNNFVSNLEWCSYQYNNVYSDRLIKSALKRSKPVICIETGVVYAGGCAAERETGIDQRLISGACLGKKKTAGGFHWAFI